MTTIDIKLLPLFLLSARNLQFLLLLAALFNFCFCNQKQPNCLNATCGTLLNLSYPLGLAKSGCGHPKFQVHCQSNTPYLTINDVGYKVLRYNQTNMNIASGTVFTDCGLPEGPVNLSASPFNLADSSDLSIPLRVGCQVVETYQLLFPLLCSNDSGKWAIASEPNSTLPPWIICNSTVRFPVLQQLSSLITQNVWQVLRGGFEIEWNRTDEGFKNCSECMSSGGICGYNSFDYSMPFHCYLPHSPGSAENASQPQSPDSARNTSEPDDSYTQTLPYLRPRGQKISIFLAAIIYTGIAGIAVSVSSIVVISCIMVHRRICYKRTLSEEQSMREFMDPVDSTPHSLENFLNHYSSQVPTRYSYSQITAYTNNLAEKVGKGGFGTVYKGKLPNGHLIAVKILDESKQSEQQFMAEVATVGRTYHVNLVRLLGYCYHGSKRALVYEYMVNGSLDKYVHGGHQEDDLELDWKRLYSIALGTARGIAYLHQECKNRILHCDIKPHNILLDADFCPKVADFGLAKISDRGESHVSVANRGTFGYASPEMWSRMYGSVTDRSDVYSYGILLMEMVGGRKNMDIDNRESRSSKFFYTEWAYKQVEKGDFGNLRKESMSEEDQSIAKKLSLVGLWCIQFKASNRPPMSKVIKMLEEDIDIATPPCPFPLDTPLQLPISDQSSSTNASEIQMINPTSTQTARNSM